MDQDDPLFKPPSDRTIFKPTPGKVQSPHPSSQVSTPSSSSSQSDISKLPAFELSDYSQNQLINAAAVLFMLVAQLRSISDQPDVNQLRSYISSLLKKFDGKLKSLGVTAQTITAARYSLCTLIDETVLNTPWGSSSNWSQQSLLSEFHNDVWGGEKFFTLIQNVSKEPAKYISLLEFVYVCISFGLEGKYRVTQGGNTQLQRLKDNLFETIRSQRGDFEKDLSPSWRGVEDKRNPLVRYIPYWVLFSIAAVVLSSAFLFFKFNLNSNSSPIFAELNSIGRESDEVRTATPKKPTAFIELQGLLAEEVRMGLVSLHNDKGYPTIRLIGKGLFASGSANLNLKYENLIERISDALSTIPGRILVSGHTDDIPIRSLRFQSNWDLSRERALTVAKLIAVYIGSTKRLAAEGLADTEPLMPNDSRENRAINRRVEISLLSNT